MDKDFTALHAQITALTENEPGIFAVTVIDLQSSKELNINSRPMRSASLIKLFIMAEAFARMAAGSLLPSENISFTESDIVGGAGLLQQLPAGTSRTVLELIELMITESDNIATNLLIERFGAEAINSRIQKMGCSHTCLRRHMMDFAAAAAGRENLTSVTDTARAMATIYHNHCIGAAADQTMREILERQTDRCKIPLYLPNGTVCQHKTGELPGAEHDAGIIYNPSGAYVLAIMSDELPDPEHGRHVVARLSKVIYDFFTGAG